jgi:hypothetical protein
MMSPEESDYKAAYHAYCDASKAERQAYWEADIARKAHSQARMEKNRLERELRPLYDAYLAAHHPVLRDVMNQRDHHSKEQQRCQQLVTNEWMVMHLATKDLYALPQEPDNQPNALK